MSAKTVEASAESAAEEEPAEAVEASAHSE
jgi:hypothetical protein